MWKYFLIPIAHAGVIAEAPTFAEIFVRVFQFLLSIAGIMSILSMVFSGILYLTAAGDEGRIGKAKKIAIASVTGIVVVMGAWILLDQLAVFFTTEEKV